MTFRFSLFVIMGIVSLSVTNTAIAKDSVSPITLLLKEQSQDASLRKRSVRNARSIDEFSLDLKTDKARCEEIEKVLAENYGPATTTRRNLRIWELPNTDKSNGQSKMITIMAGEENGSYFVKLDRRGPTRGNNPRLKKAEQRKSANISSQAKVRMNPKTRSYERD